MPSGFTVREAVPQDVTALARLHVQTFIETHGGRNPPTVELRTTQWRRILETDDGSFCFVVENHAGELIGFARGTLHDGAVPGFVGELNKIYVLRRYHRLGLGRRLIRHVASRFLSGGVTSMLLFGDARNPSNPFYERLGAERLIAPYGEFHGAYGWRDLRHLAETYPTA